MPSPTFNASAKGSATNPTTISVTIPSGAVVGDFMLLFAAQEGLGIPTTPSGWSVVPNTTGYTGDLDGGQVAFYRFVQAGDPGSTVTVSTAATGWQGQLLGLTGWHNVSATSPINTSAIGTWAYGPVYTAPQVTTTAPNCAVIALFAGQCNTSVGGSEIFITGGSATSLVDNYDTIDLEGQNVAYNLQAAAGLSSVVTASDRSTGIGSNYAVALAATVVLQSGGVSPLWHVGQLGIT
jgi:hypothetical protein